MSLTEAHGKIKIQHSTDVLTNNASLLSHHGLATRFGLFEDLAQHLHGYQSNRAYPNARYPYLQILSHANGGIGIEDTRTISADLPLGRLLFPDRAKTFEAHPQRDESYFPAPNTLGDWYRSSRIRHAHRARKINRSLCRRIINQLELQSLYIDIDSKMHASSNRNARQNRNGIKGYAPLYATLPNLKLVLDPLFRPGNANPASHNASMIRTILTWLEGVEVERVLITIDNAGCQVEVMEAVEQAHRHSDKQIHVCTRPSSPDETIPRKMFKSIKEAGASWKPIKIYYENNRKKYRYLSEKEQKQHNDEIPPPQILDADYPLTSGNDTWDGRLILIREPVVKETAQKSFAGGWQYYPVLTNDWRRDPIEIPSKYNQRGAGENKIGEIVQGGKAERFPCREDHENALYLALCAMGHNLNQAVKKKTDQLFEDREFQLKQNHPSGCEQQEHLNGRPVKKPAHQEITQLQATDSETTGTSWMQFTIQKFRNLLLSLPARITSESRYQKLNFSTHDPFGELLEEVINACWKPEPLSSSRPPP